MFLLCACIGSYASAKELSLQPHVSSRFEYDDNIQLITDNSSLASLGGKSAYGVVARAGGLLGVRDERYEVMLDNVFELRRYDSDLDLDSENIFIDLKSRFDVTQRNQFSLKGNYTRDTTLTSEQDVTGLVQNNIIRESWSITPEWTYYLNQTHLLQASYTHFDAAYEESNTNFFDYTTDYFSLSYIQQWSETFSTYLSFSTMLFEVPEIERDTTEHTVMVGTDYQFLPTWSASFSVGGRFTTTEIKQLNNRAILGVSSDVEKDDAQGIVFSAALKKRFESGAASISFSRSTSAQGNGRQQVFDRFAVGTYLNMTETVRLSLNGGIHVTTNSGSQRQIDDRTYYYVTPSVNWKLDRYASLNAGYRYRMQEFDNKEETAVSNAFMLTFTYQWDKFSTQQF
jgi:hypothetical protein